MMMMMMMMGAYNGAGSIIHWMTPPPLTSHLKTFWVRNLNFRPSKYGGYLPTATRC